MNRILVADDHSIVRFGLRSMLEILVPGCKVDEACNGEEVMERIRKNNYQLVLLDLVMPNTDPGNLLHFIKNFNRQAKVRRCRESITTC